MVASFVAVRVPSGETVLGRLLRQHPGGRVLSVLARRRDGPGGLARLDFVARFVDLPRDAIGQVVQAWPARYGEAAVPLPPDAAVLPAPAEGHYPLGVQQLLRHHGHLGVAGHVAQADWVEQWIACSDAAGAGFVAVQARARLSNVPGATVRVADPGPLAQDWLQLHAIANALPPGEPVLAAGPTSNPPEGTIPPAPPRGRTP